MNQTEIYYTLALLQLPGIGSLLARKLIERTGSAEAVFKTNRTKLEATPGIGPLLAKSISTHKPFDLVEKELRLVEQHQIQLFHFKDENFPLRLRQCPDHPLILFGKGALPLNVNRIVAVVGTRAATDYGRQLTEALIQGLISLNVLVISGLAYGIDIHAHRLALKHQLPTVGVLGHGLGRIYPAVHKTVAERMLEQGGLLTEFLYDTGPDKENFPKRNRIVAGMADAVVVVEAATNGGALITASIANDYNRDVFAFPGRVGDKYSSGCHALVRNHKAALITSADELCEAMGWLQSPNKPAAYQTMLFPELEQDEQLVYELLKNQGQMGIDLLSMQVGFSTTRLSHALLGLEFKGLLRALPGKQFVIN
ncbi:MAG: DNA-processing protein DprA [Bacteroidia bacterium]